MKRTSLLFTTVLILILSVSLIASEPQHSAEWYEERGIEKEEGIARDLGERQLRDIPDGGLVLIPESSNERVMAFDPVTGDLVDANFVPSDPTNLSTPIAAALHPDGNSILVSDQIQDGLIQYDLDGNHLGWFAPSGGVNNNILDNVRGWDLKADGTILVTSASGANADAIAEFDDNGDYLGNFIEPNATIMDSPFCIVYREAEDDYLVSASSSGAIHRYDNQGTYLNNLVPSINFPQQIHILPNGNFLVAGFSNPSGVYEYDSDGTQVGFYNPVTGLRGVYELGNGNILTTNGSGVHEINRQGALVETKISGVSARHIYFVGESTASQPIPFEEGFESGALPDGWSQEYVVGENDWEFQDGGSSGYPPNAYSGDYNAAFLHSSTGNTTKLITPPINIAGAEEPTLRFWHAQVEWAGDQDELHVYYKTGEDEDWVLLESYTDEVDTWTEQSIELPNPSSTYYIAFEAVDGYGYGVCIDDVEVFNDFPGAPIIAVDPSAFTVQLEQDDTTTRTLTIANEGDEDLTFSLTIDEVPDVRIDWLTASVMSGTVEPDDEIDIELTFDSSGMALGVYEAEITIDHNAGDDIVVPATLHVLEEISGNWWFFDFENDDGGWIPSTDGWDPEGDWEWTNTYDVTNYTGSYNPPPTAYSGTGLWGTIIYGDHTNSGGYTYLSQTFDFTDVVDGQLAFYSWLEAFGAWDYGQIEVNGDIVWGPEWGTPTDWELVEISLSAYDGLDEVEITFAFYATTVVNRSGWYIDDVLIGAQDNGFIEGQVNLIGGDGDVTEVEVTAGTQTVNPDANGVYTLEIAPGVYDVTASLFGYQSETIEGVEVFENLTTSDVDFDLGNIEIAVTPDEFDVLIESGNIITETMTITNDGVGDLEYNISIMEDESRNIGIRQKSRTRRVKSYQPVQSGIRDTSFDERDPNPRISVMMPTDDIFDLIDHFPVGVGGGEYSVTTDGDHIYTAAWNSTGFYRYETDGTYIGEFTVTGAGNLRDLTYDGQYFYGSPNSNTVYEMDLANETLVSQFTTTASSSIRGIAYDPDHDGFWVTNGWDPPITLISRTGTTISTINPTASSFSGLGWENVSDGGPHLWAYTQEVGTDQNNLVQIDITNGSTVQTFDVASLGILAGDAISGGMDITDELVPGIWTFIGTSQNDVIWILELAPAGPQWLTTDPVSGVVPAGESVDIDVIFDATELDFGIFNADIVVNNNAQEDPIVIPASMIVESAPQISVDPESFEVTLLPDDTLDEELQISNIGGEDLTFSIDIGEVLLRNNVARDRMSVSISDARSRLNTRERIDWLSVDPESGTVAPGGMEPVTVTFDASGLEPDSYYANITITNNAGDPVEVPVTMIVETPALLVPTNLEVEESSGLFTWDEPDYHASLELIEYEIYLDGDLIDTTEDTDYQFVDLEYEQTYEAGVKAIYNWGDSDMATVEFTYLVVSADDPIVTVTQLNGNYPNPFNPDTNISFSLSEPGRVRIDIFNIKGEKVRTLLNSELNSAHHTIVWDGRDDRGRQLGSGVFFYRMQTGEYTDTKKMLMIK